MLKRLVNIAVLVATPVMAADPPADLTGVWTNTSLTQLTRPRGQSKLVVTPDEAKAIVRANGNVRRSEADARPSDPEAGAPTDRNTETGYNAFWMDWGSDLARVNGEYRTSWIVEPADGQLPLTAAGVAAQRAGPQRQRTLPENPEALAPNDRCLIASRGSGGPGMLNNIYNNTYQIVQTKDAVAIMVEMVHDTRVIPVFADKARAVAAHRPADMHPWLGDSVGWWEGRTLVVETLNVHPEQGAYGPIFLSDKGRVVERFTRRSEGEIFYAFEVEDPVYYTTPWRAEMSLTAQDGPAYEYACHEGNYALGGILAGARAEERKTSGR